MVQEVPIVGLPLAVSAYLTMPSDQMAMLVDDIFTEDAIVPLSVHDQGHSYAGLAAIRSWQRDVVAPLTFTRTITAITTRPGAVVVRAQLDGDFPGSPVDLHHHFSLVGDRITVLTICP